MVSYLSMILENVIYAIRYNIDKNSYSLFNLSCQRISVLMRKLDSTNINENALLFF